MIMDKDKDSAFFLKETIKETKRKLTPRKAILLMLRERNWSQAKLARKVGISPQGLNNYLRGFWDYPDSIKIKIAEAFEVDSLIIWGLDGGGK